VCYKAGGLSRCFFRNYYMLKPHKIFCQFLGWVVGNALLLAPIGAQASKQFAMGPYSLGMTNKAASATLGGLSDCKPIADTVNCRGLVRLQGVYQPIDLSFDKRKRLYMATINLFQQIQDVEERKQLISELGWESCSGHRTTENFLHACYVRPDLSREIKFLSKRFRHDAPSRFVLTIRSGDGSAHRHFVGEQAKIKTSRGMQNFANGR
jgi:hypothetical protein